MTAYAMPKVGDLIAGKYRLEKVAGEGGMGVVYAAEHLVLKQRVAVKVLLPDAASSDAVVERFSREAQAGARIQSEHVARVMDAGSLASGAPFLVMEYLEGCDLEELLALQKTLPVVEVADVLLQALEGLAHAHAVGIVHRDLKPANLFLACRPDGGNAVKLLDFGISKSLKARPEDKKLTGQHVLGSPVYMSPEQLRNAKEIDGRADVWSLGVVAYELLTGTTPFDGDGVGEIFAAILEKEPVPAHERNPSVPAELSAIIARCLKRNLDERWSDAGELARAVAPFGSGAHAAVVDRIEQLLARAKMLSVPDTPTEARRVVDAIAAAAERARTSHGTDVAIPLSVRKPDGDEALVATKPGGPAVVARASRLPAARWLAAGVAAALVVVGLAAVAGVRAMRTATAATETSGGAAPSGGDAPPAPTDAVDPSTTADDGADEPPMVMDLPETPSHRGAPSSRSRAHRSGKPQRPKFLNSRE